MASDRGTYHNGTRVQEAVLTHQDRLTIGPVTFVIQVREDGHSTNGEAMPIVLERQPQEANQPKGSVESQW